MFLSKTSCICNHSASPPHLLPQIKQLKSWVKVLIFIYNVSESTHFCKQTHFIFCLDQSEMFAPVIWLLTPTGGALKPEIAHEQPLVAADWLFFRTSESSKDCIVMQPLLSCWALMFVITLIIYMLETNQISVQVNILSLITYN